MILKELVEVVFIQAGVKLVISGHVIYIKNIIHFETLDDFHFTGKSGKFAGAIQTKKGQVPSGTAVDQVVEPGADLAHGELVLVAEGVQDLQQDFL